MTNLLLLVLAYLFMEFVAWFSHKYIMHGFMWSFHKDHHVKNLVFNSFFEKNDIFFLLYATPAIILLIAGFAGHINSLIAIGTGITLYGFTYFFIHDVIIHHRIPLKFNFKSGYMASLIKAHEAHHFGKNVKDFKIYGLLVFPARFLKQ
jgi:beta-carotene 3-hydroxylase